MFEEAILESAKGILENYGGNINEALLPSPSVKTSTFYTVEPKFVKAVCKANNYTLIKNDDEEVIIIISDVNIPTDNGDVYPVIHVEINNWGEEGGFDVGDGQAEWLFSTSPTKLDIVMPKVNGRALKYKFGLDWDLSLTFKTSGRGQFGDYPVSFGRRVSNYWRDILERGEKLRSAVKANKHRENISTKGFEEKLEKLANAHDLVFEENGKNKWSFGDIDISPVAGSDEWRVRIGDFNFSFFKAKDLKEVFKIIEWYCNMPVRPTGKF